MNIVLWIIAGLLAVAFLAAGAMKLTSTKEKLAASGMGWTENYSANFIKVIGLVEILAAVGLILPGLLSTATILVPLAALGLVIVMAGAIVVHAKRHENQSIVINGVLLLLAAVVVWGRFGPYAFAA
ncbi:DoxX family protein [Arthrobacter sp. TWP1-1]|uniref:DoxX family protein n=1 Tax=Arthrobacter sp. TWP1-1 TaxID=2804568 RepID=UPI003CE9803B